MIKTYTYKTSDWRLIELLVRDGKVEQIGIDWIKTLLTWRWHYYFKYTYLRP